MAKINLGKKEFNVYFILCCIYLLYDTVFKGVPILHELLILCIIGFSVFHIIYLYRLKQFNKILLAHFILFFITSFYGIYECILGGPLDLGNRFEPSYSYLLRYCMSCLPIYSFYYFYRNKKVDLERFALYFYILLFILFFNFYLEGLLRVKLNLNAEFTNNYGYTFLSFIPLLCLYVKRTSMQLILTGILVCFIIATMKRGAILIVVLCFVYIIYVSYKKSNLGFRLIVLSLVSILMGGTIFYINYLFEKSKYFQNRILDTLDGNVSSRDYLLAKMIDYIDYKFDFVNYIYGIGANSTVRIAGNFAHNDWMEFFINQGIISVIVYAFYFLLILCRVLKLNKIRLCSNVTVVFTLIFIQLFLSSIFSMSYNNVNIYLSIAYGFSLVITNKTYL